MFDSGSFGNVFQVAYIEWRITNKEFVPVVRMKNLEADTKPHARMKMKDILDQRKEENEISNWEITDIVLLDDMPF